MFKVFLIFLCFVPVSTHAFEKMPTDLMIMLNKLPIAAKECAGKPATSHRVVTPSGMMTDDHQPHRLNIKVDHRGNIITTWCG